VFKESKDELLYDGRTVEQATQQARYAGTLIRPESSLKSSLNTALYALFERKSLN
jgi:hypothetical protein